jgi:hypothetical protein
MMFISAFGALFIHWMRKLQNWPIPMFWKKMFYMFCFYYTWIPTSSRRKEHLISNPSTILNALKNLHWV